MVSAAARWLLALLGVLCVGCPDRGGADRPVDLSKPARWPAFPADRVAAQELVAQKQQRRPSDAAEPSLEELVAQIAGGRRLVISGRRRIHEYLQKILARDPGDAYLLWGVYHDAGGQLEAFRRLIGPGGVAGLTHVAVEQFDASGRWRAVTAAAQSGDDTLIAAYLARGDGKAFENLKARQARLDYTAWKYGYLDTVMDLLPAARAGGLRLLGCDMPRPLQRRLSGHDQALRDRLRELHCLLHLWEQRPPSAAPAQGAMKVAMVWGQSHLSSSGIIRFLPAAALVSRVLVYGFRPGPLAPEARAAKKGLMLTTSVLVPTSRDTMILLLPGPRLGAAVDRARDPLKTPVARGQTRLVVSADVDGLLRIDPRQRGQRLVKVGRTDRPVMVASGRRAFVFTAGSNVVVGRLDLPPSGELTLHLGCHNRTVRSIVRAPK